MKTGLDIVALAQEIARRQETKRDFVVASDALRAIVTPSPEEGAAPTVNLAFGEEVVGINNVAHGQIAEYAGIPKRYYDKMLAEEPKLLADNVNTWLTRSAEPRKLRTIDGVAGSLLSPAHRSLDYHELFEAVVPVLLDLEVEIISSAITDRRMYIKCVDKRVKKDIPDGRSFGDGSHVFFRTLSPGLTISDSEVGEGALKFEWGLFDGFCTNYAEVRRPGTWKKAHIGARAELGEDVYRLLTDQTKRITDAAVWSQSRDVVRGAFNPPPFYAYVEEKIVGMQTQPITGKVDKVVELTAKKFSLNGDEQESVLQHFIKGGDLSRFGLFSAITRAAQDRADYDRATDFEALGGKIIELPKGEWQAIAQAA